MEQQLFSSAPIYKDLELTLLADSIARTIELNGADSELEPDHIGRQEPGRTCCRADDDETWKMSTIAKNWRLVEQGNRIQ